MNGWDGLLGYDIRLYERLLGEKVTNSHCGTQINNLTHARSIHLALYVCSVYVGQSLRATAPPIFSMYKIAIASLIGSARQLQGAVYGRTWG
jgi:hypothetical protein